MSPLHAAVGLHRDIELSKRRAMIELLLANGANLKARDQCGLTPLNVAAMGFPYEKSRCSPNEAILRSLLQQDNVTPLEKIYALELTGVMIIFHKEEGFSVSQVFRYWNEALDLRESAQEAKVPLGVPNNVSWRAAEWTTKNQLEELQQRKSFPDLMMQAILITSRILLHINSKGLVCHLWDAFISKHCSRLYQANRITELLNVAWIMLELGRLISQRDEDPYRILFRVMEYLVSCLKKLRVEQSPIVNSESFKLSFVLVFDINRSHLHEMASGDARLVNYWKEHIQHTIHELLTILSGKPEMVTPEIKCCLHQLVQQDRRDWDGYNLLLLACNQIPDAGTLPAVRLLLEVGADPNTIDKRGNSPLHHVAFWMKESDSPIATLLLEHGALPHIQNHSNETPLDVWTRQNWRPGRILYPPTWTFTVVMPLMWWCARSIRKNGTPYKLLPESLQDFVSNNY